jgi:hypothetical protein
MTYSATTYRLLISAPGDVPSEDIATITDAVARWNASYGQNFGATVVPLHWGVNSAAQHGERPQAALNSQLVESADIVIALFWHRLGSDTGAAESGTVEEIEEAHGAGAYVGILRCTRDYPQSVDTDQLERLREFFERVGPQSLMLEYGDEQSLSQHVEAIINQAIARAGARAEGAAEQPSAATAEVWPRVESSEHPTTDPRGRISTKREWQLVLSNTGTEPARDVSYRLEAEGDADAQEELPLDIGDQRPLEVLAPGSDARYQLMMHMGVAPQARCVVSWSDAGGEHENTATLRFF